MLCKHMSRLSRCRSPTNPNSCQPDMHNGPHLPYVYNYLHSKVVIAIMILLSLKIRGVEQYMTVMTDLSPGGFHLLLLLYIFHLFWTKVSRNIIGEHNWVIDWEEILALKKWNSSPSPHKGSQKYSEKNTAATILFASSIQWRRICTLRTTSTFFLK